MEPRNIYKVTILLTDSHGATRTEIKERVRTDVSLDFDVEDVELMELDSLDDFYTAA